MLFQYEATHSPHLLILRATVGEGGGERVKLVAHPTHRRWSLIHGGWQDAQGCFLVGNN